jgi:hypothetical protein
VEDLPVDWPLLAVDVTVLDVQVPYPFWQPFPQWPVVDPQYPYFEQHVLRRSVLFTKWWRCSDEFANGTYPNVEPVQVYPVEEPQVPDLDTTKLALDFLGAATEATVVARRKILRKVFIVAYSWDVMNVCWVYEPTNEWLCSL